MSHSERSRIDMLFDLLADELAERLGSRIAPLEPPPAAPASEPEAPPPPMPVASEPEPSPPPIAARKPEPLHEAPPVTPGRPHAARLMGRLALGLLVVLVLVNIPFNRHGTTLATAMPDSRSLIVRNGLVVKEAGDAEIYVYQNERFRWISSLDAFEHYGFTWGDVHVVEDGFLDDFEIGPPIHVLLKCAGSPHIYRLENGFKRWIVDIETFEAEGHVWEDVRFVSCEYLRSLPDGETIPPGYGPPPQP